MRLYALLVILLFSGITTVSQNCDNTLSGIAIDLHDGSVLSGAVITVAETQKSVLTNIDGKYLITNLCNQNYSLKISHHDCDPRNYSIKISGNTIKNLKLEHHLEELNQVTIQGKAFEQKTVTAYENTISEEEIEQYSSGTLGDALNSISGVSSLNTGNTIVKPIINGLHSSRVIVVNNGVRLEDQEWGAEHAPNIDVNTAGKLTIIKGAGALQYGGDAIGGIVIAEAAKIPVKDTLYGKTLVTASSNGRGTSGSTQLTKSYKSGWYGTLHGTLKYFGDSEAPNHILSNTGARETNASFSIGLNRFDYGFEAYYSLFKTEIGILSASHISGISDLIFSINNDTPLIENDFTFNIDNPKQDVTHNLARIKGFKKFHGFGKINFQYDFQQNDRLEFDRRLGDRDNIPAIDLRLKSHALQLNLDSEISDNINLKAGVVAKFQNNFATPSTGVRRLIPDYDKYDIGGYATLDYQINNNLTLEAGGRFDYTFLDAQKFYSTTFFESRNYDVLFPEIIVEDFGTQILTNPQFTFNNPSASIGALYKLNNNNIYFNFSTASRAPNPSELFSDGLHQSAARIERGDLSFESEISRKFSISFEHQSDKLSFSINPFINSIDNYILIEPTDIILSLRGSFVEWEYRQTDAELLGFDIDASYKFAKNFQFNHQFSFVKGYDRTFDEALIDIPPVSTKNEIVYTNSKINNLRLALESQFVFEQNEFPDNNFDFFLPLTQTNEFVDISTPPEAYHLLNFNSSIDFKIKNNSNLKLGLKVTNLLDTTYRNYLNRLRFFADEVGRNISLNIKINY